MDHLTRSETLQVLASMGVDIPKTTSLQDDVLEKRLRAALDAAQEKYLFSDRFPLNTQDLREWPLLKADELRSNARPLLEAVRRGNLQEIRDRSAANLLGGSGPEEAYGYPFINLRRTTMSLADVLDRGLTWCTIQDPVHKENAINIRFLQVYELDDTTPAIVLLYRAFSRDNFGREGARWCQHQMKSNPKNVPGAGVAIDATVLEQKLLLKLLGLNRKLLPPDYAPKKQRYEEQFRASVLLPLGPLGFEAINKLGGSTGCAICEERGRFRCKQCQSVWYCSADCQRADWPTHKQLCLSLKGGRWCKVTFRATPPGMEKMHISTINQYTDLTRMKGDSGSMTVGDPNKPFPNTHGDKPFLVKLQVGLGGPGLTGIMVYDRQRSFNQVYVTHWDNPVAFEELVEEMEGPRGGFGGLKMYRWAKRTGDWELSICVDRQPQTDVRW
ncbi:hypothetical protein BV20DRAFT_964170 [Pilatotrama ljubarskyi]|nr:hypothetical protein BV20DRAFT_964170 [Pilatotrama ljubarskyi]